MQIVTRAVIFLVAILFLPSSVLCCSCVYGSLKDRYRRAEAVFVGGIYDFEENEKPSIQNYQEGLPVLLVKRKWKGVKKELVAVDFDFPQGPSGTCPRLYNFKENVDYLVFAYGKDLRVNVECSDTQELAAKYNNVNEEISKLNSRWFRFKTWAWPF